MSMPRGGLRERDRPLAMPGAASQLGASLTTPASCKVSKMKGCGMNGSGEEGRHVCGRILHP